MDYCKICGSYNCKKHSFLLAKKIILKEFSGSSPPEIFVGRWNYPNVYAGILSPTELGNTKIMSSYELWHKNNLKIPEIINLRKQLIYGRSQTNIKKAPLSNKFISTLQEVAMTHQSISAEFKLKKPISKNQENEKNVPLIPNAADVSLIRLQENPKIKPKVDYLVNDKDAKSTSAIIELDKAGIETSLIQKLLSAGLLGLKKNRKLVPTRWAITAVDDTLSKEKLKKIKLYPEISEILLFHSEYLGNHYEFLLLPDKFSFEVIERSLLSQESWHDYETIFQRKSYANSVTGAYYANRLALCEYLDKIKKQAKCLVIREIRPEYSASLGVGILRQISRDAFQKQPEKFSSINEALNQIQSRLKQPILNFTANSIILKNLKTQTKLTSFL
ncbi:MAG: hypothetical protein N3D20_02975 [Candidatus Pacearchaeota archaeon]|nr:hypothetical protein [Candidatus Pacearchaeota archaeon]